MTKGTFLRNNWLLCGISVVCLMIFAIMASWQGGLAVEFAGLQLTLAPHEGGGVMLSFLDLQ